MEKNRTNSCALKQTPDVQVSAAKVFTMEIFQKKKLKNLQNTLYSFVWREWFSRAVTSVVTPTRGSDDDRMKYLNKNTR